jgi:dipeptidyl aminopeptidase/acylaminoacyl peptidase
MKNLNLLLIALIATVCTVNGQDRYTPELLWKLGRAADPRLSPDGKNLIYAVTTYNMTENKGQADIFIMPADGGAARPLVNTPESENSARWRPDGKRIAFIMKDKDGASQLWEVNPDGSDKKQITAVKGGINQYGYSPVLSHIWYTSNVKLDQTVSEKYPDLPKAGEARIIDNLMFKHWNAWHDYAYSHLFIAAYENGMIKDAKDVMPGEKWDTPMQPFGGDDQITFSPDGKQIAYTSKKLHGTDAAVSTNSDIYLYDITSGKTENLTEGMNGYDQKPVYSPDGKTLLWLSMEQAGYESDRNRLFSYTFSTRQKRELVQQFDYPVDKMCWTSDSRQIYFIAAVNATRQVYVYDTFLKSMNPYRAITKDQADYEDISIAGTSKSPVIVCSRMDMTMPTELYRIDAAKGTARLISNINTSTLDKVKKSKVEKRMIRTTDGKEMLTWVIFPPDFDPAKKYPALLYCQGGPQSTVSQFFSYRWNFSTIAAQGYIVVAPNRRGLPSFGEEWNDQIAGDWGGQAMKDLLTAIDTVSKENYVDKNRLGAVGASFGGYSVYWLAGNHQKRFKVFAAHCGVFNLTSEFGSTEEMFFALHDMNGAYWENPVPKSYNSFSPHLFVKNWDTPLLVIHNEKDFRVPVTQGMEAFTAAQLQKIPSRFLYFPDEGHHVLKPQNGILWHRELFEWLGKYLK